MPLPTSQEPVNETAFTTELEISSSPIAPPEPVTILRTPLGRPASCSASIKRTVQSGATEAGFTTTVFPVINAGAILQAGMAIGKFQGVSRETTPSGLRNV